MKNLTRTFILAAIMCLSATFALAQSAPKKVYDETIDPVAQIDKALAQAQAEGKYVVCQLGGNWCPWCLRFAQFITNDSTISQVLAENFVYIHVNYEPSRFAKGEKAEQTTAMLKKLGNPVRFGFPVFVVLDEKGIILHTQDSSFLEDGKSYDKDKTLRFFKNWTPTAVKEAGGKS